jgi:adenosylcobinamide-phosphate synthase
MIVGRNTDRLGEAGVARAAIESLAENFSDGIVAPAFWLAVAGLTGGALYKATNTADSIIGHRAPRYAAFRWAARFDDLIKLPASRLAAIFLVLAAVVTGASPGGALRAARREA